MSSFTMRSLLSTSLLLSTALAQELNCPWTIQLKGSAEYGCGVTGHGWSVKGENFPACGNGATICAPALGDTTPGGGKIQLIAPGAGPAPAGTLIECTFTDGSRADQVSNCDISLVDGYNFDVFCHHDLAKPMGFKFMGPNKGQFQCSGDGAELDANAQVCKNTKGPASNSVNQVAPLFQKMAEYPGIYVTANEPGPMVNTKAGLKGGNIICDVNGGYGHSWKRDQIVEQAVVEERDVEGAASIEAPEASGVGKREMHRLRHAQRARPHARARGLDTLIGGAAAGGKT